MRLLLDTHVLLWAIKGRLSSRILESIYDDSNVALVSAAALWEVAIKLGLGKIDAPPDLPDLLPPVSIDILPIRTEHVWAVRDLPKLHRDPFDRLMVAQAMLEELTLVTHDRQLTQYACRTMLV